MKSLILPLALVALLAGCSSTKLNERPASPYAGGGNGMSGLGGPGGEFVPDSANAAINGRGQSNLGPEVAARGIVYFDFDRYVVKPEFQRVIQNGVQLLKSNGAGHATIEGNTDSRGSREYNLALGQRRADAVRRALASAGVPDGQLESVSYGAERPAAEGNSEGAMAKNRRAEIVFR